MNEDLHIKLGFMLSNLALHCSMSCLSKTNCKIAVVRENYKQSMGMIAEINKPSVFLTQASNLYVYTEYSGSLYLSLTPKFKT